MSDRPTPDHDTQAPEAWAPLLRLTRATLQPLQAFLHIEAASGVVLLVATAIALGWANSPWAASYFGFWESTVGVRWGDFVFERSLAWVVNDILMVIFFFVVGMEIRRELAYGELSSPRRAALPAAAALGGMIAPAIIFLLLAGEGETRDGWGVPMATDIAFAVGVLALLGKRVPAPMRILLLALAVIDDLGAILVIAFFYSSGVGFVGLGIALLGVLLLLAMRWAGLRLKLAYVLPGFVIWAGIYTAGIHPTIAGVLMGLFTPVRAWYGPRGFLDAARSRLETLDREHARGDVSDAAFAAALRDIEGLRREAQSPAERLIELLHPWVAFGIMPIFALANAGVALGGLTLDGESTRVAVGVALGLVLGKPLGVVAASLLSVKLRLAVLPTGVGLRQLAVVGVVAGIGFTMALFIAQLAFADARLLDAAKLGVLSGSAVAMLAGLGVGAWLLAKHTERADPSASDSAPPAPAPSA